VWGSEGRGGGVCSRGTFCSRVCQQHHNCMATNNRAVHALTCCRLCACIHIAHYTHPPPHLHNVWVAHMRRHSRLYHCLMPPRTLSHLPVTPPLPTAATAGAAAAVAVAGLGQGVAQLVQGGWPVLDHLDRHLLAAPGAGKHCAKGTLGGGGESEGWPGALRNRQRRLKVLDMVLHNHGVSLPGPVLHLTEPRLTTGTIHCRMTGWIRERMG
jgi:hypothetical protein